MRKLKNRAGMTLLEMLCALTILVLLVAGMGSALNAGTAIYREAIFEADSAALEEILNTALGDILRFSEERRISDTEDLVFTNREYGVKDGHFQISSPDGGTLQIRSGAGTLELVNAGAYGDLVITDLKVVYVPQGGYFEISYNIRSEKYADFTRRAETVVRVMND